ncbi:hypothetical protein BDV25DRAFT_135890 [Aspergillus avenaceus]|uniref:Rhodopsin domain-containing protein n=1 Tax=Aspergillus avenaceus TaxID=36643 RepID=A0A5N6U772_ASPAV|nr:hypothetical protein BDV25DRAFT_135890 [Aspergillus avenaceus]
MSSPDYWSRLLLALSIAGAVLATVFYILRLYSHSLSSNRLDAGDAFLGLGLLLSYGITITTVIAAVDGVGVDISHLPPKTARRVTLLFWITQKFWPPTQVCVKVSIIILLRRLLGTVEKVRSLTVSLLVFTVVWGLTALFSNIFQCWPPQYFWNKQMEGYCIRSQKALFMAMGSLSLLEDVVLLATPIVIVWRLQMAMQKKLLVTGLFSLGAVVCVFSLMRLVEFRDYQTGNLTATGTRERVWTLLEIDLAIVCASIVLMPPLIRHCLDKCRRRRRASSCVTNVSEYAEFLDRWPFSSKHCTNFSQDRCSEVRAQAYRTPVTEISEGRNPVAMGDIMVETAINRDVHDREMGLGAGTLSLASREPSTGARETWRWSDDMSNVNLAGVGFTDHTSWG